MESRLRRLSHAVPAWVKDGAVFHIRIRIDADWTGTLVEEALGLKLLDSVAFYQSKENWNCRLMLLMPDHLHALISFNPEIRMGRVVGNWKHFHATQNGVRWQDDFFDHRIRNGTQLDEKAAYIRRNPVALGLCEKPEDWKWVWNEGVWI